MIFGSVVQQVWPPLLLSNFLELFCPPQTHVVFLIYCQIKVEVLSIAQNALYRNNIFTDLIYVRAEKE